MMAAFLYIDPGTGSMLFSILIGAAATVFFLAKAAWLKLKVFFSGKKSGVVQDASYKPYVIYCEGKQYHNLFRPIAEEFERRHIALSYLTSAKDDPVLEASWQFVKPEFIGEGNAAFARLNMLSAGIVLMTTPGLDVYQMKRSKRVLHYANIIHAASDPTMMEVFALDFFDAVLLTGDYQVRDIRILEKQRNIARKELVTVGCTYLDVAAQKVAHIPQEENHPFTVLVSPSWGPNALLAKYGEKMLDPLIATGWRIIVRPHPQSKKSEAELLDRLAVRYKDCANIEWDYSADNLFVMKKSDIMISDFSGIIYDYTFLFDKPVMYVNADIDLLPYDAYDLPGNGRNIWQFTVLKKMGVELREEQFADIAAVIKRTSDSPELADARAQAKAEAWMHQGEAALRTADYMIAKLTELTAKADGSAEKSA